MLKYSRMRHNQHRLTAHDPQTTTVLLLDAVTFVVQRFATRETHDRILQRTGADLEIDKKDGGGVCDKRYCKFPR